MIVARRNAAVFHSWICDWAGSSLVGGSYGSFLHCFSYPSIFWVHLLCSKLCHCVKKRKKKEAIMLKKMPLSSKLRPCPQNMPLCSKICHCAQKMCSKLCHCAINYAGILYQAPIKYEIVVADLINGN